VLIGRTPLSCNRNGGPSGEPLIYPQGIERNEHWIE
jgi:hypothetical protein